MHATVKGLTRAASEKFSLFRVRSKVLAREHRRMRADLVAVRRMNGLTQKDVADLMGVTQQAVNKLERYDADPRLSTLRRYANAVGALVEHKVSADQGQSLFLSAQSRWERLGEFAIDQSCKLVISASVPAGSGPWVTAANAKRTDFALSA